MPLVHDAPLFAEVAKPMSDAPPLKKRPNWAAATIVEPNEYVSGSTIVLCWLDAFVNGSTAIWLSGTFALAETGTVSASAPASARTSESRLRDGEGGRERTETAFRSTDAELAPYEKDREPDY